VKEFLIPYNFPQPEYQRNKSMESKLDTLSEVHNLNLGLIIILNAFSKCLLFIK
jgi:hypothetical protein